MKTFFIILCTFMFTGFSMQAQKSHKKKEVHTQTPQAKPSKYSLKSGELLLFSEMAGMRTKITVVFDDYGNREATESVGYRAVEQDLNIKIHTRSILDHGVLTTLDLEEGTGKRFTVGEYADAGGINFATLTDSIKKTLGLELTAQKDTVLGYVCDVWSLNHPAMSLSGKYSVWNNLVMRSETMTAGVPMSTYVVKIEANKPADPAMFTIPDDIIFADEPKRKEH